MRGLGEKIYSRDRDKILRNFANTREKNTKFPEADVTVSMYTVRRGQKKKKMKHSALAFKLWKSRVNAITFNYLTFAAPFRDVVEKVSRANYSGKIYVKIFIYSR